MSEVDIEALVTELAGEVTRRRRAGDYPQGLEHQLEAEFAELMRATDRHEIRTDAFGRLIDEVAHASGSVGGHPEAASRLPGGGQLHAATARLVARHTNHLAERVRSFGEAVHAALVESKRIADAQRTADERQLVDILADVRDRLAVVDSLVVTARELEERLAKLEASIASS